MIIIYILHLLVVLCIFYIMHKEITRLRDNIIALQTTTRDIVQDVGAFTYKVTILSEEIKFLKQQKSKQTK